MFGTTTELQRRRRMLEMLTQQPQQSALVRTQAPGLPQSAPQSMPAAPMPPAPAIPARAPARPAPSMFAPPGAPAPAEPQGSDEFTAVARRIVPDDSPLAMEQSAQTFTPKKPTLLNQLGFLAQGFDEGPRGYSAARQNFDARQRADWERQQTAASRTTAIDAVRRILATDQDPNVRAVAQMAGTPEAFIEWYAEWKDKEANRGLQSRELDQGDRGLDQNDKRIGLSERELEAGIETNRRQTDLGWYDAQTRRKAVEDSSPGKDPLERGMIANDVDQVQQFADAASTLGGLIPDLNAFAQANTDEPGTGGGSWASWFPLVNKPTEEMRQITSRLAPALRMAGSGSMSDKDMEFLLDQVPNTGRSQQANLQTIQRFKAAARRAQERETYARQYLRRDRSLETFNRFWSAYINDSSIADGDTRDFATWMRDKQQAAAAAGGRR
jgi:hypothetical protein